MTDRVSELTLPQLNPYNRQAVKEYIFNETGNIMLASTELASQEISQQVRDVFAEVSVFFAAMTKAITTTTNPGTKKPYSIYDYDVLQGVIDGSGLFVQVTEEDVHHASQSFGAELSKELVEGLLGLATGMGELGFAEAMIAAMGKEGLRISESSSSSSSKVANIVFVCEHLLGMPIVSVIVVSVDTTQYKQQFQAGPCIQESTTTFDMVMHKDTYMFVTPRFVRQYAGDLVSVENDLEFAEFVSYLTDLVLRRPIISGVHTESGGLAPGALDPQQEYVIVGAFLDHGPEPAKGETLELRFVPPDGTPGKATASVSFDVQSMRATFSVAGTLDAPAAIGFYAGKSATTPYLVTPTQYTVRKAATPSSTDDEHRAVE